MYNPFMKFGPVLVMTAAALWAVDALIRTPLTRSLSSISIVFWEHVIGLFVLSPLLLSSVKKLTQLSVKQWITASLLSLVSSIGGTILFTQALSSSFQSGDFVTPLLLQKLQPLIVILLSWIFLKERIQRKFWIWAPFALAGGYLMSFGLHMPAFSFTGKELVVLLSLSAAACWASGTILSKTLLHSLTSLQSVGIRFLLAIPLSFLISFILNVPLQIPQFSVDWIRFVLIACTTGAGALGIYYIGLKRTPAHIATIAELSFPLLSVLIGITPLNPYGQPQTLTFVQLTGIILLLIGVYKTSTYHET